MSIHIKQNWPRNCVKFSRTVGKRSPVLGYNHNFKHRGLIFHVQTEDSGIGNPHLFTHLFHGGVILSSRRMDYNPDSEEDMVKTLMQSQHKAVLKDLKIGTFDDKIDAYLGSNPDLLPRKESEAKGEEPSEQATVRTTQVRVTSEPDVDAPVDHELEVDSALEADTDELSDPIATIREAHPPSVDILEARRMAAAQAREQHAEKAFAKAKESVRAARVVENPGIGSAGLSSEKLSLESIEDVPDGLGENTDSEQEDSGVYEVMLTERSSTVEENHRDFEEVLDLPSHPEPIPHEQTSTEHSGAYVIHRPQNSPKPLDTTHRTAFRTPAPVAKPPLPRRKPSMSGGGSSPSRPSTRADSQSRPIARPDSSSRRGARPDSEPRPITRADSQSRPIARPDSSSRRSAQPRSTTRSKPTSPIPANGPPPAPARPSASIMSPFPPAEPQPRRMATSRAHSDAKKTDQGIPALPKTGRSRSSVVVSRPAVIIGAPPKGANKDRKRSTRKARSSLFGKDLISEKSLDEVIMAYLSEDGSDDS